MNNVAAECSDTAVDFSAVSSARELINALVATDAAPKILASAAIFLVAIASGAVPMRVVAQQQGEGIGHRGLHVLVKYGNAFSAGIFLAMGIVHLMPEASKSFQQLYGEAFVSRYHPGELLVIAGYSLILALQRVVFPTPTCPHALGGGGGDNHHGHDHHIGAHHHTRAHASVDRGAVGEHAALLPSAPTTLMGGGSHLLLSGGSGPRPYGTCAPLAVPAVVVPPAVQKVPSVAPPCCRSGKHCVDATAVAIRSGGVSPVQGSASNACSPDPTGRGGVSPAALLVEAEHLLLDRSERIATPGAGWTLLLALSAHAVCEGLAIGLQCGLRNVAVLASAVCAHKWAESFALSNSLMHEAVEPHHHTPDATGLVDVASCQGSFSDSQGGGGWRHAPSVLPHDALAVESSAIARAWRILIVFACATPVGILLGTVMHSQLPPASAGVVKALSAGTFVYIGASEVVVEEFVQGKQYWGKWFCFLLGVAVMYGLNAIFGH